MRLTEYRIGISISEIASTLLMAKIQDVSLQATEY